MTNSIDQNALYPIREVSRLTGIKPITLRAWERRYNLIEPVRTDSGHRLYTQEHIDFLNEALRLMDEGIPISRVKVVLSENQNQKSESLSPSQTNTPIALIDKVINTCSHFQIQQLERLLDRIFADYSLASLAPLLVEIEQRLKADTHGLAVKLWHESVCRRIEVRLHNLQTQPILPGKRIFIQHASKNPDWLAKLVALFCFEQGYQPIQFDEKTALEKLIEVSKPLGINGIIFIDLNGSAALEWKVWFQHYASMRTWVLGDKDVEENEPPSVNCELRAWPEWFKPLQL